VSQRGSREIGGFSREYRFLPGSEGGLFGNQRGLNLGRLRSFCGLGFSVWRYWSLCCSGRCCWFRNCNRGFGRRLDHYGHCGRRHDDGRARRGACRSLGNHRFGWRARGNGGRLGNDGRRGARLRNNLARFRLDRRSGWLYSNRNRRRWTRWRRRRRCFCSLQRQAALSGFGFLFLLLGLDGLQHVTGLGDMREINFWRNSLRGARGRRGCRARVPQSARKMRANLIGLIFLQRTGVGLAGAQAELC
jgi:hypothetical protein